MHIRLKQVFSWCKHSILPNKETPEMLDINVMNNIHNLHSPIIVEQAKKWSK